ncbi:MAG: hypothetical protein M0P61_05510 [Ignavibacteriaceae bacterium]|jgi:hypothetical protein|nr:hypothetical protein [Ignavibacteriaceae bacterium]
MKKVIISILIPSLLLSLCSCYTTNEISKDEFTKAETKDQNLKIMDKETYLITKDDFRYRVYNYSYNATADTINLNLLKPANENIGFIFSGKIAVSDVKNFEVLEKNSPTKIVDRSVEKNSPTKIVIWIVVGLIVGYLCLLGFRSRLSSLSW